MIFATVDNSKTLIVGAADDVVELERFYAVIDALPQNNRLFVNEFQPSVTDMMLDERFERFKKPPFVFEFDDTDNLAVFVNRYDMTLMPSRAVAERQMIMIDKTKEDDYFTGTKTIEEVLGLEENDPWDTRTEEQKAEDEDNKKQAEAAKKAGKLSGDSFGPNPKRKKKDKDSGSDVRVTDIRTTRNEDGTVEIDDVLAVKGLHDDNGKGAWLPTDAEKAAAEAAVAPSIMKPVADAEPGERFYRFVHEYGFENLDEILDLLGILSDTAEMETRDKLIVAETATSFTMRYEYLAHKMACYLDSKMSLVAIDQVDANGHFIEPLVPNSELAQYVDPFGYVAIFHRVDVPGRDLNSVVQVLKNASEEQKIDLLARNVAARGYVQDTSWLACATKLAAETIADVLKADNSFAGIEMEIYGVNDKGERIVPKGVEIIEEVEEIEPPRPWNDRAEVWHALDDDAKKAKDMRITGKEFLFCGSYRGPRDGCIVYIAPRKYFNQHGEMWDQSLNIALPGDMKELRPGIYQSKSRDWISLSNDLNQRGFTESLGLMLHVNTL